MDTIKTKPNCPKCNKSDGVTKVNTIMNNLWQCSHCNIIFSLGSKNFILDILHV